MRGDYLYAMTETNYLRRLDPATLETSGDKVIGTIKHLLDIIHMRLTADLLVQYKTSCIVYIFWWYIDSYIWGALWQKNRSSSSSSSSSSKSSFVVVIIIIIIITTTITTNTNTTISPFQIFRKWALCCRTIPATARSKATLIVMT